VEEDFTLARLYISKMKSEAKSLIQHCSQLETAQAESNKKLDEAESQLSQCKLLIQQVVTVIRYVFVILLFFQGDVKFSF
jgi:kinesin family member 5